RDLAKQLFDLMHGKANLPVAEMGNVDEDLLRSVLSHLRVRTGHDFSKYKRSTVLRRIARRMQVTQSAGLKDYEQALCDNAEEAKALLGDLLISVTTFFRDGEAFETLAKQVLPEVFKGRKPAETIRVWA